MEEFLKSFKNYILMHKILSPKYGEYSNFNFKNKQINNFLEHLGIKLYSHQVKALEKLYEGKNIVVTTPTASGKSEIFRLAIFDNFLSNPNDTYLLIYPMRALINNQYDKFQELNKQFYKLTGKYVEAEIFTGDVPFEMRKLIIQKKPNILFTTPDMLHYTILKNHRYYNWIFKNLKYVVVDELHTYNGVFGSNVAYVFKRLLTISNQIYNKEPQIIALSATLKNPINFAQKIFNRSFELIDKPTNPTSKRHIVVLESKQLDEKQLLSQIILELVLNKIKSLIFFDSRTKTEELLRFILPHNVWDKVTTYKGTLSKDKRNDIEYSFKRGDYLVLLTTNALEVGIDIGDLDAVINYGIPSNGMFSLIQRFGRAGRKNNEALNAIVLRKDGLDYYYKENLKELFEKLTKGIIEYIPITLNNRIIAKRHILYLINEVERLSLDFFNDFEKSILSELILEGKIQLCKINDKPYVIPAEYVGKYTSLRCIRDDTFILVEDDNEIINNLANLYSTKNILDYISLLRKRKKVIEEVDIEEYYRSLLPGMVYFSQGVPYMVKKCISKGNFHFILVEKLPLHFDVKSYVNKIEDVTILKIDEERVFKDVTICKGRLKIVNNIHGFIIKGSHAKEYYEILKGYFSRLSAPVDCRLIKLNEVELVKVEFLIPVTYEFETEGVWFVFPDKIDAIPKIEYEEFLMKIMEIDNANNKNGKLIDFATSLYNSLHRKSLYLTYLGSATHIIKSTIQKNLAKKDLDIDDNLPYYIKKLVDSRDGVGSGLHAIEHVIIKIAPIFTYVDSRELGGRSYSKYNKYPYNDKKVIFIYDANEGGVGLSEILYENAETLLEKAYKHLINCKCKDGCPYCIYSTKCGNFNEFLDKWQAIKILETILNTPKSK